MPTREIKAGEKLDTDTLKSVDFPCDEVPEGTLRRKDLGTELYAKQILFPDKLIRRDAVSPHPPLSNIADQIGPGYRATTLTVDAISGVDGWATAGTHVDVVVTYLDHDDGDTTALVAEDAVVLSLDRNMEPLAEGESGPKLESNTTVTLLLPALDAVKLQAAREIGKLGLMLRAARDMKAPGDVVSTARDFYSARSNHAPSAEPKRTVKRVVLYGMRGCVKKRGLPDGRLEQPVQFCR
jgi:Flp pilus assembly protein CpaB